jgi:hypothetical protein
MRISDLDHPVRVVLFWKAREARDASGVSVLLDRHRAVSLGRQAAVGAGRLSGAQRYGADPLQGHLVETWS